MAVTLVDPIGTKESMGILDVDRSTILRWAHDEGHPLKGYRIGDYWAFERHAVEALAAERSATASPALAGTETPAVTS